MNDFEKNLNVLESLVKKEISPVSCVEHQQYQYMLYCRDCQEFMCVQCRLKNHMDHRSCPMDQVVYPTDAFIKDSLPKFQLKYKELNAMAQYLKERQALLNTEKQAIETQIDDQFEILIRKVNEWRESSKVKVWDSVEKSEKLMANMNSNLDEAKRILHVQLEKLVRLYNNGTEVDFYQAGHTMTDNLKLVIGTSTELRESVCVKLDLITNLSDGLGLNEVFGDVQDIWEPVPLSDVLDYMVKSETFTCNNDVSRSKINADHDGDVEKNTLDLSKLKVTDNPSRCGSSVSGANPLVNKVTDTNSERRERVSISSDTAENPNQRVSLYHGSNGKSKDKTGVHVSDETELDLSARVQNIQESESMVSVGFEVADNDEHEQRQEQQYCQRPQDSTMKLDHKNFTVHDNNMYTHSHAGQSNSSSPSLNSTHCRCEKYSRISMTAMPIDFTPATDSTWSIHETSERCINCSIIHPVPGQDPHQGSDDEMLYERPYSQTSKQMKGSSTCQSIASSILPKPVLLTNMASLRVGTLTSTTTRRQVFSAEDIKLTFWSTQGTTTLTLPLPDIKKLMFCLTLDTQVMFLGLTTKMAGKVRFLCHMKNWSGPYFDPDSPDMGQRFVVIQPTNLTVEECSRLERMFEACRTLDHGPTYVKMEPKGATKLLAMITASNDRIPRDFRIF